ncbi:MAG: hypothetical protein IKO36_10845 [Bacteroidaceae bacterium]|nr:hypothetical protein [Bacteroidaceae bacterium]
MQQKVIRNFHDFTARKVEGIAYVNDYKQLKTMLNNYWQNDGLYSTIEQYSDTDSEITIYDNDGRFGSNKEIGKIKVSVKLKDDKCDIFYNGKLVTLSELEDNLRNLVKVVKK